MLNKKQSIPQVCSWGMGFLETPINKMPVKDFEMDLILIAKYAFLFCLILVLVFKLIDDSLTSY